MTDSVPSSTSTPFATDGNPEDALKNERADFALQQDTEPAPSRRKPGRPKGSRTRTAARPTLAAATSEVDARPPFEYERTDGGVQAAAFLGKTLWGLAAPWTGRRGLTAEEAAQLGEAIDPVLQKYLPSLKGWEHEATLAMVLVSLWGATKQEEQAGGESDNLARS